MHPHQEHRAHKHEKARVSHITKGYASGGGVHSDEAEDKAMVKHMVKPGALKAHGGKVKHRADRAHRAKGGRVKHKGTNVNVIIAPQGGHPPMPPVAGLGSPIPPHPPMPAPGPAMPPPPMAGPGPMPHHSGGRAYASGGRVKDGPAWKEGVRNGTQVQHNDSGKTANQKPFPGQLGRGKPVTYATGGPVEHPVKGGMAPHLPGGSGGGEARLVKEKRAAHR